ncbi:hypothetical protein HKX48_002941 [Thoreauomyces humboldtii]|nr:hypothetical protein HKX48_002941 [Thoreauomyces humboldtii]
MDVDEAANADGSTVDDLLATLLDMGFDYFLSRKAIQMGQLSLEEATNWILRQTDPVAEPASGGPLLSLGQRSTPAAPLTRSAVATPNPSLPSSQAATPNRVASSCPIEDVNDEVVVESRLKTSRREYTDMAIARDVEDRKKFKKLEKNSKAQILQQIQEDRDRLKERKRGGGAGTVSAGETIGAPPTGTNGIPTTTAQQQPSSAVSEAGAHAEARMGRRHVIEDASASVPAPVPAVQPVAPAITGNRAVIQFRLPSNAVVKASFSSTENLNDLFAYIGTHACPEDQTAIADGFTLLQPFPRRLFTSADRDLTVMEAGLFPNAMLNVIRTLPPPAIVAPLPPVQMDIGQAPVIDGIAAGGVHGEPAEEEEEDDQGHDSEEDEHEDDDGGAPVANRRNRGQNFWGAGQGHRLTDGPAQPDPNAGPRAVPTTPPRRAAKPPPRRVYNAPRLKAHCVQRVTTLLANPKTPASQLAHLPNVGLDLGQDLLQSLMARGLLDKTVLARLGPCRFQSLVLGGCRNVTDSWVAVAARRWGSSLVRLDLKGCELLTDGAFEVVKELRCLEELDLSGCRMTDGVLQYLTSIPHLRVLSLSRTKITSTGFSTLSTSPLAPLLTSLSIAHCNISTPRLFQLLQYYVHLEVADVTGVYIDAKAVPPNRSLGLTSLDLSTTGVSDAILSTIVKVWKDLEVVNLRGCTGVTVAGLTAVAEALPNLSHITFPSRELDPTPAMSTLYGCPLRALDLGGSVMVTDATLKGLEKLADSLQELDLSGTKITDVGTACLAKLTNLRQIHLDRTVITDRTVSYLLPLGDIHTLSLASTGITSDAMNLIRRSESARGIKVLNLARTACDDEGMTGLKCLVNLSALNLDHSAVTIEGARQATKALPGVLIRSAGLLPRPVD